LRRFRSAAAEERPAAVFCPASGTMQHSTKAGVRPRLFVKSRIGRAV
jgi:hypothetical protein